MYRPQLFVLMLLHFDHQLVLADENIDWAPILLENCCKYIKFASNDEDFLNRTHHSEAFKFLEHTNSTQHSGSTPSAKSGTFGDLLHYPFGHIRRTHHGDYVEYDHHHDPRIQLMNNATYTANSITKKIWAIYDMTAQPMKIIEILGSDFNKCPKQWKELNARVYYDDDEVDAKTTPTKASSVTTPTNDDNEASRTNEDHETSTINELTVECYDTPPREQADDERRDEPPIESKSSTEYIQ